MSVDEIVEHEAETASASAIAVKELTSVKFDDKKKSNIDFKTRLTLGEISAHCCLEWLNDVMINKDKFKKELRIIDLVDRMKRLRPSIEGKAREGLQDVMKSEVQAERNSQSMLGKVFTR